MLTTVPGVEEARHGECCSCGRTGGLLLSANGQLTRTGRATTLTLACALQTDCNQPLIRKGPNDRLSKLVGCAPTSSRCGSRVERLQSLHAARKGLSSAGL